MSTTVLLGLTSFEKIEGQWIFGGASNFSNILAPWASGSRSLMLRAVALIVFNDHPPSENMGKYLNGASISGQTTKVIISPGRWRHYWVQWVDLSLRNVVAVQPPPTYVFTTRLLRVFDNLWEDFSATNLIT